MEIKKKSKIFRRVYLIPFFWFISFFPIITTANSPTTNELIGLIPMKKEVIVNEKLNLIAILPPKSERFQFWQLISELPIVGENQGELGDNSKKIICNLTAKKSGKHSIVLFLHNSNNEIAYRIVEEVNVKEDASNPRIVGIINIVAGVVLALSVQLITKLYNTVFENIANINCIKSLLISFIEQNLRKIMKTNRVSDLRPIEETFFKEKIKNWPIILSSNPFKGFVKDYEKTLSKVLDAEKAISELESLKEAIIKAKIPIKLYITI